MRFGTLCSTMFFVLASGTLASAQMIVHAVSGSVKAVTPSNISVLSDANGAEKMFGVSTDKVSLNFASELRSGATSPEQFQKVGDYVVVYYYGYGDTPTAVGVKDLGAGPFTKTTGTVESYDKHSRQLTLKDDAGKDVSLTLNDQLVVDTDAGVGSGRKFTPRKGDHVRVTYSAGAPATVALLGEML